MPSPSAERRNDALAQSGSSSRVCSDARIGYVRLALIPVFLAIALSSTRGHSVLAAVLYAVIGWADYLDGFTARLTGQYSRRGALLDPIVDRLLVVSGMAVAWRFHLLPHWALAVVIARELLMLALSRYALRRGVELKINWPGRLGVAPMMGAPFFAMLGLHAVALVSLYAGMALALLATALYVRRGVTELRAAPQRGRSGPPPKASSST